MSDSENKCNTWFFPTQIHVGPGCVQDLVQACGSLNIGRPLLVTDEGIKDLPMIRDAIGCLDEAQLPAVLFADVKGNPVSSSIDKGVGAFREHKADGVIAFGGGSALDVAKLIAFMQGQTRPIWDFEDVGDLWTRAISDSIVPVIAVPTTAGTGSEVGRAAVITNEQTNQKKVIFHPKMLPSIVLADPRLTVSLPANLTAATGMDAFIHCFEAYCAPGYHPMAEGIALEGMRLIARALPMAYGDGTDIDARSDMLTASSMGAVAFQKGLGAVHAVSHAVGAVYDTHHGLTNAVLLPYVMKMNEPFIKNKMKLLGRVLNLPASDFGNVLDWVLRFRDELDIPHTLDAIGVPVHEARRIGEMASHDPTAISNPAPVNVKRLTTIFQSAFEGRL